MPILRNAGSRWRWNRWRAPGGDDRLAVGAATVGMPLGLPRGTFLLLAAVLTRTDVHGILLGGCTTTLSLPRSTEVILPASHPPAAPSLLDRLTQPQSALCLHTLPACIHCLHTLPACPADPAKICVGPLICLVTPFPEPSASLSQDIHVPTT